METKQGEGCCPCRLNLSWPLVPVEDQCPKPRVHPGFGRELPGRPKLLLGNGWQGWGGGNQGSSSYPVQREASCYESLKSALLFPVRDLAVLLIRRCCISTPSGMS